MCDEYRAIVLDPGNPSMKSQIKQLAAVESKLLFRSFIVPFSPCHLIGQFMSKLGEIMYCKN